MKHAHKINLFSSADAGSLGVFRIIVGASLLLYVWKAFFNNLIQSQYIDPAFHFSYPLLEFVRPLPEAGMYGVFVLLGICSFFLTLGVFYRPAAAGSFILYTYIFLIDKALYNNHYYLTGLFLFLFMFMRADAALSARALFHRNPGPATVPAWNIFILRAQLFIMYFYAGVAKLSVDWLRGEPMRTILQRHTDAPLIGAYAHKEWLVMLFSYGGLIFDLSIGFLLAARPTRAAGIVLLVCFNLINGWIFNIGTFPFLMIGCALLFLDPQTVGSFFGRKKVHPGTLSGQTTDTRVVIFVAGYLILQLLIPLRHWLYPGNVKWNMEGNRFSWRMKATHRIGYLKYYTVSVSTGKRSFIDHGQELTAWQASYMASLPDMVYQYAQRLGEKLKSFGIKEPVVTVDAQVALNGRKPQHIIDPNVNLAEVKHVPLSHASWILPLKE